MVKKGTEVYFGYPTAARRPDRPGFTLIELLTVISIIALLLAILLPTLFSIKERGRRAVCLSNVRQFIVGIHIYAGDNDTRLPSGLSEMGEDEHTPVLSRATRNA
ncbi:MAG: prepilin-type N-terminal cleavage/methylation domain-containing protein, partial [bacterium]